MAKKQKSTNESQMTNAELTAEWETGKAWIDSFTRDFQELDNLVDAVALSRSKNAPLVGDVTLPAAVRSIPRGSIQNMPTFSAEVNGTKNSIPAYIADYIVRRIVFNQDTFGKGILSTMQIGAESALSHGFQAFITQVGNVLGDFGTTMKLVHYNDLTTEVGIFDASESDHFDVRTRVTKSKIKKIIQAARANTKTTWNIEALQALLDAGPNAETYQSYLSNPRYNPAILQNDNSFDIVTRYEVGPYGEIVTFSPNSATPLRVMKSKSKFGYPRVQFLTIDPAQLSPFGVSRVRLASPTANYANIYLQSTAKMLLLNSDPPVLQRGQFTTPIRLKRGALWQTLDPNSDVKLQELSNTTLQEFQSVMNFVDNQIYAIMGVTSGQTGAGNTDSKYSKTGPGVKMEQNVGDLSTTQITNILENFLRQYALTALDLFVSEQVGETPLIVDDKCKDAINNLVPGTIGDDNQIIIDWADFYDGIHTWTVDIDLSMSSSQLDAQKRSDLQDMLVSMEQTTPPNDIVGQQRIKAVENELLEQTLPEVARQTDTSTATPMPQMPLGGAQ